MHVKSMPRATGTVAVSQARAQTRHARNRSVVRRRDAEKRVVARKAEPLAKVQQLKQRLPGEEGPPH